ncbi:uncharacterized protein LOC143451651 [Clavelina lepadiformis]|uniref:uncharacterized protein LOC143451651 n=1 Tax=Clavelina lepadiformis TaxID=159417 RepID=UPI00404327B5
MSNPEEQKLTEDKPQLVQPDNNEESSSGESDEQPGTSRAVAMQAGMPHDSADTGNQVLQTMENAEASQSALSRIDPGLIELANKMAESRAGPVMIINAPKIYHHDERQYQHHDRRQYQDKRKYKEMDISDLKKGKSTQSAEKQIKSLDFAKRFEPRTEQQESANNPFDLHQLNTQPQDPLDVTHPKQPIEANPHVEPHTDISEVTNQSNALNIETPSTTSNSQTEVPSTSPSIANLPTTSSADQRILKKREEAIGKVLQEQNKRRENDIRLQAGIDVSVADIPIVHPKYTKVSYFRGKAVPKHEIYAPSTGEPDTFERDEDIEFEELLKSNNRFTAFIGYPGSGKTTLSKRLAKTEEYKCLHYKFMEMPVGKEVSFRKLIMDNIYPDLDDSTREDAWEWIKENQKSCLLLFDGLDQAEWSFKDKVPKVNYDTPQSVPNLLANLCNKQFLPDIKLIFTSRPHSIITLPAPLRPDSTILLGDLPLDSMKELFYFYAGASADKLWNDLSRNAKIVFALCFNPLLLQLVIAAGLAPTTQIGKISTTTRVFATVLENLRCSDNAKHQDITLLVKQLSELAYKTTMRSSVVITRKDLTEVKLEPDEIQDIVVGIYAHFAEVCRVFDGHVKYYFAHQLYQEFFTAKFIVNELPMDKFKHLVSNELFSEEKWSVIRRFVCGLLIDMMKDSSISKIAATGHDQPERSCLSSPPFNRQDEQVEEQISLTQEPAEENISSPEYQSSSLLSPRSTEQQAEEMESSDSSISKIATSGHEQGDRSCLLSRCFCCLNRQDDQVEEQISLTQKPAEEEISSPEHQSSALLSPRSTELQAYKKATSSSDVAEKRRIWTEALKSQLVRFEKMQFTDWSHDDQRRYISLLCELNESSDMELFNMASLRFPTEMILDLLKLSSSEVAIFCDVLRKQRNDLKKLGLNNCFFPGDVERLISAISEMPGKVKWLRIIGNKIKDIPGPEFFAKIEEDLWMVDCFEDGRFANSSEIQKIQLVLDQLHGSRLEVYVGWDDEGNDVYLTPRNHC